MQAEPLSMFIVLGIDKGGIGNGPQQPFDVTYMLHM